MHQLVDCILFRCHFSQIDLQIQRNSNQNSSRFFVETDKLEFIKHKWKCKEPKIVNNLGKEQS